MCHRDAAWLRRNQIWLDDEMTASRKNKIPRLPANKRAKPRLLGMQETTQSLARDAEVFLERLRPYEGAGHGQIPQ
jgi:hypothetical protein